MSTDSPSSTGPNPHHYDAVLRISEALSACREPEELARVLADQLSPFLHFDFLDVIVVKENLQEIEWQAWGKQRFPVPDLGLGHPAEWPVINTQEPLHIADWDSDPRFPQFKQMFAALGLVLGSVLRLPLTTPHRRLGTVGIASISVTNYSAEDISFLQLIARVVAFALDDGLNLRRSQAAQTSLQEQNDRLSLLLEINNHIVSILDINNLFRAASASIRKYLANDFTSCALFDEPSNCFRTVVLDFPEGHASTDEAWVTPVTLIPEEHMDKLRTRAPAVFAAPEIAKMPPALADFLRAESIVTVVSVPLIGASGLIGVMLLGSRTVNTVAQADLDLLSQISSQISLALENALAYREISELKDKLAQEKYYLEEEIRSEMNFENIVGNSPALTKVLELVETVAPSDSTVLLLGETGTGKELIARAIHDRSRRKERTFVKLNCAAIPTGLLESELFGHEKGAFTGAITQKLGRMELADQGTLFLDEVGDIPIEIQPKLLRALQEREFERLGGTHTRKVNVRLVAATNRDLQRMIEAREFRSDLYYRLHVFPIRIPPLRERREDIPLLVSYFVQKFAKQMQKKIEGIPVAVMKGMSAWEWPGNIRELENFIERAVILTRGKSLEAPLSELRKTHTAEKSANAQEPKRVVRAAQNSRGDREDVAEQYANKQRDEIVHALSESKGCVGGADGAAARLGINRTTLLSRMRKLGIYAKQYA